MIVAHFIEEFVISRSSQEDHGKMQAGLRCPQMAADY